MEQNISKEKSKNQPSGNIWKAATPPEAVRVLREVYKHEAVVEAFKMEALAIENADYERALFWACVQEILCDGYVSKQ